ncbi:transglycosylase SLT domain-containing protein [Arenimonas fontis]|nr:transglycosylase SLT domain-containing protein [Arenimonas fontis]
MCRLAFCLLCLLCLCLSGPAGADTPEPPDLSRQRPAILEAFRLAEQGQLSVQDLARISDHPLRGWVEATNQRKRLGAARTSEVRALLHRLAGEPAADWLRAAWLDELARRGDWQTFLAEYTPAEGDSELRRCQHLAARLATGESGEAWLADARALWVTPHSLPDACDAPFRTLQARGGIGQELRWQRLEGALLAGQTGLARWLAGGLPAEQAALARSYADFVDEPHDLAGGWPKDARSRAVATEGLARLARRSPDGAETRLAALAPVLDLDEAQRARVLYQIALWTVASYLPRSAERLAAVPASAYDERLHEWRVREAMNRRDDATALQAIRAMPAHMREDPRWLWFEARHLERLGRPDEAKAVLAKAARHASFHGFLAADRLGQPYALCPLEPSDDPELRQRVAEDPGLARALELFTIDRLPLASIEWRALMRTLSPAERKIAIAFAGDARWYDRAVFFIGDTPEDLRYYSLRFPLHHENVLRREAKRNDLDPAWVAAQIRAESAFMPRARSHADARGLMQLLPSTARHTAAKLGIAYSGIASLYDPETNLVLGIAHLRHMLDEHGVAYKAIAAYNAGPGPVARWNRDRPNVEPDFWIETLTYRETREYVARVLAFSVIYDWRLEGRAIPVTDRMLGRIDPAGRRKPFACRTDPEPATPTAP